MQFKIAEEQRVKAKAAHELFLTNMIGNHVLWFVASLGIFNSYWQPLALVPVFSFGVLVYTLLRARKTRRDGTDWFVMCHWQLAARHSWAFLSVLMLLAMVSLLGLIGYHFFGLAKVAVYALVGGVGMLPTLVSVLVLIVMESDGMHQASSGKLPESIYQRFPNDRAEQLDAA